MQQKNSKPHKITKFGKTYYELMAMTGRSYTSVVSWFIRNPNSPIEDMFTRKKPKHYNSINIWGVSTEYARSKYGIPQWIAWYYTVKKNMKKEELDQMFSCNLTEKQ